jgi:hypothetical protein
MQPFRGWLRSAEARGELFCLFFMGGLGLGAVFPKAPKPFQRKRVRELVPRVLEEAPKRVNGIFKRFTKIGSRGFRRYSDAFCRPCRGLALPGGQ